MKTMVVIAMLVVRTASAQPEPTPAPAEPTPPAEPSAPATAESTEPAVPQLLPPSAITPVQPTRVDTTPPLDAGRLFGEVAIGLAAGAAAAIAGGVLGYEAECAGGCHGDFAGLGGALAGGALAAPIGMGVGVWAIGSIGDQRGSLGWTVAGSFGGAVVGVLAAAAIQNATHSQSGDDFSELAVVTCWVGGAVIGFNATRSSERSPAILVPIITRGHDATVVGLGGRF